MRLLLALLTLSSLPGQAFADSHTEMVFRPGVDQSRLYKVLRTEPKETDVLIDRNIFAPFKAIGQIQAKHGDASWNGTAFFISPCHILTNAHVMYSPKDEEVLFLDPKVKSTLRVDEVKKMRRKINADLKNGSANRSIRFDIVRGSDGRFDITQSPNVEEIVMLDPKSDYALARVDKCLGIPERYGFIKVLPKDEVESVFKRLSDQKIPLVSAGFPGDRSDNPQTADTLKINSSSKYSRYPGDQIEHFISNFHGSSGSPIMSMHYRDSKGDLVPIDREFMRNLPVGFDASKVESILVGLNKNENRALARNLAKFMHDDVVIEYLKDDVENNKASIAARIEEAKRLR